VRNPYDILQVPKNATEAEIKKSYRRLAKTHHPDSNKKDPKAADKFSEINTAYEILGDKKKREQFDRGEIDSEGKPSFTQFKTQGNPGDFSFHFDQGTSPFSSGRFGSNSSFEAGDFFNLEDLLGSAFGSGLRSKHSHKHRGSFGSENLTQSVDITLPLEVAAHGGTQRVTLSSGRTVDVVIPKGVLEGQIIRIQGIDPEKQGDLLLKVHIAPHKHFTLQGNDLLVRIPVPLEDAVLGGKIRVPTLDKDVFMTIPPMTSSGKNFRLRGKGLVSKGQTGSIIVAIDIQLPEKGDPELEALMLRKRQQTH